MSIYYIENENGTYLSQDGKRKFIKLEGKEVYELLKKPEYKDKRFFRTSTEEKDGESVYIEIPPDKVKSARKLQRRAQYVMECIKKSGIKTVSLYEYLPREELAREEMLSDTNMNTEDDTIKNLNIEVLHRALTTLTDEEFSIINLLYLSKEPLSEEKIGEMLGITQQGVSKRKQSILKKLKKILIFGCET